MNAKALKIEVEDGLKATLADPLKVPIPQNNRRYVVPGKKITLSGTAYGPICHFFSVSSKNPFAGGISCVFPSHFFATRISIRELALVKLHLFPIKHSHR